MSQSSILISFSIITFLLLISSCFQSSTNLVQGKSLKLQLQNANQNLNHIKVSLVFLFFFLLICTNLPSLHRLFLFIVNSFSKLSSGRNQTSQGKSTASTTEPPPLITCSLQIVRFSFFFVFFLFDKDIQFVQKGQLWAVGDCDVPSPDCVQLILPGTAYVAENEERICCVTEQLFFE